MNCPYCGSGNTFKYYDAKMPNIVSACHKDMLQHVQVFPLSVELCRDCLLGFNSSRLTDEQLKIIYDNYLYISPLRGIGTSKYTGMIETLKKYFAPDEAIVEIGCSEGYLLKMLKDIGYTNLLGIEPGPQADEAKAIGLDIMKTYFDAHTFGAQKFDGFYLMHVFEHFSDPFSIIRSIKSNLAIEGKIIIEVPYFSGYHHQHLFFYNYNFLKRMCDDLSMKLIDMVIENDAIRVVIAQDSNTKYFEFEHAETADDILNLARTIHADFNDKVERVTKLIDESLGKTIFWWGAGSTSVIYLNQIDHQIIRNSNLTIVDGDFNKHGDFMPGLNLQVQSFVKMKETKANLLIIASVFYEEILDTVKNNLIDYDRVEII